jgi:hypothetical protein
LTVPAISREPAVTETIFAIVPPAVESLTTSETVVVGVVPSPLVVALNKDTIAKAIPSGITAVPASVTRVMAVNELLAFFPNVGALSTAAPLCLANRRYDN